MRSSPSAAYRQEVSRLLSPLIPLLILVVPNLLQCGPGRLDDPTHTPTYTYTVSFESSGKGKLRRPRLRIDVEVGTESGGNPRERHNVGVTSEESRNLSGTREWGTLRMLKTRKTDLERGRTVSTTWVGCQWDRSFTEKEEAESGVRSSEGFPQGGSSRSDLVQGETQGCLGVRKGSIVYDGTL